MNAVHLRIPEDVVFEVLDGEAVLLHLQTGVYYTLNRSGTRVWQLIERLGRLDDVRDAMLREYAVDAEVVEEDLRRLTDDLVSKGLLERVEPAGAP